MSSKRKIKDKKFFENDKAPVYTLNECLRRTKDDVAVWTLNGFTLKEMRE